MSGQNCSVVIENMYTIEYKEECGRRYNKVMLTPRHITVQWSLTSYFVITRSAMARITLAVRRWWTRAVTKFPPTPPSRSYRVEIND